MAFIARYLLLSLFHIVVLQLCASFSAGTTDVAKLKQNDENSLQLLRKSNKATKTVRATILKAEVKCCENGGQCVLRSFCVCPSGFFGRYCELELKMADCGVVPHLGWARDRCNLCYCYNGNVSCLPRGRNPCGNSTGSTFDQNSVELEIFKPNPDISEEFPHLTSSEYDYDVDGDYDVDDANRAADHSNQTCRSKCHSPNEMSYFVAIFVYSVISRIINLPT